MMGFSHVAILLSNTTVSFIYVTILSMHQLAWPVFPMTPRPMFVDVMENG